MEIVVKDVLWGVAISLSLILGLVGFCGMQCRCKLAYGTEAIIDSLFRAMLGHDPANAVLLSL